MFEWITETQAWIAPGSRNGTAIDANMSGSRKNHNQ